MKYISSLDIKDCLWKWQKRAEKGVDGVCGAGVGVAPGSQVYTDEYDIHDRLPEWGYQHKKVDHSAGEYARDEEGDGLHEVHQTSYQMPGYTQNMSPSDAKLA